MKKLILILISVFTVLGIFGPGVDTANSATGAALYSSYCSSCHPGNTKQGATTARIDTAINGNIGGMGSLSFLTATDRQAIADYLSGSTTTNTGTGGTTTGTGTGSTTTTGATLYTANCGSCHGSAGNLRGTSASSISSAISRNKGGMGRLATLTSSQIQNIADYLSTASCSAVQPTANTGSIATYNTNTGALNILSLLAGNSTYTATLTYDGTCGSSICLKLTSASLINNNANIFMAPKKSDDNENEDENEIEDDDISNSCTESSSYDSNTGTLSISSVEVESSSYHVSLEYYGACESSAAETCFKVTAVRQNL